ncbi:hypothetical protein GCM10010399_22050 [Dactylosporangium fulvum]|uniref:Thioredoxin domain-containing protein n=1 Tax=Dactylosporangium fulvum TaxID=53359 RepID=A0ABY5W6I2_9ACTN|nr:hypothetical protein [Dactylosporangium fulvum]UWP85600.1 hypothetical protein Dfulv_15685 [Dactylosporangium fulvum]
MDTLLAAAAIGGVVLGAGNLFLTLALAKKVREASTSTAGHHPKASVPEVGDKVGGFSAPDAHGSRISHTDLGPGRALLLFLMPGCGPCELIIAALPQESGRPTFAFIVGDRADAKVGGLVAALPAYARAVVLPLDVDIIESAFHVGRFPTVLEVEDGFVTYVGSKLPELHPAR